MVFQKLKMAVAAILILGETSRRVFTARLRPQFRTTPVPNARSSECPSFDRSTTPRRAVQLQYLGERRAAAAMPVPVSP